MALLVHLRDGPQGPEHVTTFPSTPVRIGRNPLNDLALDYGFVSQWHGVIKFDRSDIVYVDLGSTNGTKVDGERVQGRTPVRIVGPGTLVSVGPLELRLRWTDGADEAPSAKPAIRTQFVTSLPNPSAPALEPVPSSAPASGLESGPTESAPPLGSPLAAVQEARTAYETYRREWASCLAELTEKIEAAPPALREMTAFFIASEFPEVTKEPEFGQMLSSIGVNRVMAGCFDIEEWLQRLTHDNDIASPKKHSPALAMEHVGAVLEVFADSFLELQHGYGQFEKEMGLHAYDDSPLSRVSNLREVIGYLLDPDAEQTERLNDLKRAFAGFALHQVAILGASVEGARDLLHSLSPGALASVEGALSSSASSITLGRRRIPSFLMNLWPVAPLVSWNRYKHQYEIEAEGDRFTQKLFGRNFVRAYLALVGSQETR